MFEAFVVSLIMMTVSAVIQMAMAEKPKSPEAGKLEIPTARAGDTITFVFGTVRIKQSNVIWFGKQFSMPIKQKGGKK